MVKTNYIINLDKRIDKWNECLDKIKDSYLQTQNNIRFSAFNGYNYKEEVYRFNIANNLIITNFEKAFIQNSNCGLTKGELGCYISHVLVLTEILNNNTIRDDELVGIFEDDFFYGTLYADNYKKLENIEKNKDVDFLYIGGRFEPDFTATKIFLKHVDDHLYYRDVKNLQYVNNNIEIWDRCTSAYMVRKSVCRRLIDILSREIGSFEPVDHLYASTAVFDIKMYDFFPHLFYSPVDYKSDIVPSIFNKDKLYTNIKIRKSKPTFVPVVNSHVSITQSKSLLQLAMIVKNAGIEITEMLNAIKPYIDKWTIVDTGSTDGTQTRINTILSDIPGTLYQEPFVDFSTARNTALDYAGTDCEYIIMLDDTYKLINGNELRIFLQNVDKKYTSFNIFIEDSKNKYYSNRIFRASAKFRYIYRVHEVLDVDDGTLYNMDEDIYIQDIYSDYMNTRSNSRYFRDYKMLKEDLEKNPDDPRLLFYLAKTCDNLKLKKEAVEYYTKRILSTDPDDEVYESVIGLFSYKIKDSTINDKDIKDAIYQFPNKPELTSLLTMYYYINQQFEQAYLLAYKTISNIQNLDPKNTIIYRKNLLLDNTIVFIDLHFLTNRIEEGVQLLQKNLSLFPNNVRLHNIKHAICKPNFKPIKHLSDIFVIHTGNMEYGFIQWDPEHLSSENSKASGSEIMAINVASELTKLGYKCYIFGNFNFNQKILDGIEYRNANDFISFAERNIIDWLVISRSFDNLYYPDTVKKVYLWVHDMLPYSSNDNLIFQTHKTKFKKVLCLSNWHKNLVSDELGIPLSNIHVTRNSIDIKRYIHTTPIVKQPLRFIYASAYYRGLTRLLKLFPRIKARFPSAELYIFCNDLEIEQQNLIDTMDGVKYSPRVSQNQIAIEFLKSDIWFYPTEFKETYCIIALEAQMGEALCVTTDCGSLQETVGNRGVVMSKNSTDDEMLKKLFFVLENPTIKNLLVKRAKEWAMLQDTQSLVREWINLYKNN